MIPNSVTNETAHVTNWILYSGCIDLDAVIARAEADAKASKEWSDVGDDPAEVLFHRDELLTEALAYSLKDAFYGAMGEVFPTDHFDDFDSGGVPDGVVGMREESYRDCTPEYFFLTLLAPAMDKLSFYHVAELVREHKPATA